jgi:hypothetical protein
VRFANPCRPAKEGEQENARVIPSTWQCVGWGLIAINGGNEGKPGQCEFVEGNVTATGVVGKPTGSATDFAGSPCQTNIGFALEGKPAKPSLVAAWTAKQKAEVQQLKEHEATPEAQTQRGEEAKQEAEEAKRTQEAKRAEEGGE